MPLDPTRLSAALRTALIADAVDGISPSTHAIDNAQLTAVCNAIAAAVVTEITANAMINPLGLVAPPSGGPVTGTGTIL